MPVPMQESGKPEKARLVGKNLTSNRNLTRKAGAKLYIARGQSGDHGSNSELSPIFYKVGRVSNVRSTATRLAA